MLTAGHRSPGRVALLAATTALAGLAAPARAANYVAPDGSVGLTSYVTLPFQSAVWQLSWGSGAGFDPAQLFWSSGSHFTNGGTMAAARNAAAGWAASGIVPMAQAQRWEDTFEVSLPAANFPNEPAAADGSYFAADRASGIEAGPEYKAWAAWIAARPTLPIMANDGGTVPNYFRSWGGSWGYVSPLMPLGASDCPTGLTTCTYGDWLAARWGQTAALSGAVALGLSDFTTAQPGISTQMGFNPPLISRFERSKNVAVPAGGTSVQSAWIIGNAMPAWNDYLAQGYANFDLALATDIAAGTGQPSLLLQQCSLWPALLRFYGVDQRTIAATLSPDNYACMWDVQSMQIGRGGQDPVYGIGAYAIAAAREPDLRNGATIEASDNQYWSAIAYFNPTLTSAAQQEKGLKLLKRAWLEAAWAHVATRSGTVRRALALVSRDYWDGGTVDPTVTTLMTSIVPTRPFGLAVYYSTAAERSVEQSVATGNPYLSAYGSPSELLALKNAGVPVDYFVSDAALSSLTGAAKPAGWVILEHPELIPTTERQALEAVAPVLTSASAVASFAAAPLAFTGSLTGTGFYDQNGRLIVTVTNPASSNVNGTVRLQGLANGTYTMLDLFTNTAARVSVASGQVAVPVAVGRWDTRAFAFTPAN